MTETLQLRAQIFGFLNAMPRNEDRLREAVTQSAAEGERIVSCIRDLLEKGGRLG
jgi:hypothetical protein